MYSYSDLLKRWRQERLLCSRLFFLMGEEDSFLSNQLKLFSGSVRNGHLQKLSRITSLFLFSCVQVEDSTRTIAQPHLPVHSVSHRWSSFALIFFFFKKVGFFVFVERDCLFVCFSPGILSHYIALAILEITM